jgi:hypothetical protein
MSKTSVNVDRVRRLAGGITEGDVAMLSNAIQFCGDEPGFKTRLAGTLEQGYDYDRKRRLQSLLQKLNEAELVWLCENHADLTCRK